MVHPEKIGRGVNSFPYFIKNVKHEGSIKFARF